MSQIIINNSLDNSLVDVMQQLGNLLNDPNFINKISLIFGNRTSVTEAKNLIENIVTGQHLPEIEVVMAATINGGNG
ncbi:MAG: hypothetical protein ACRC80_01620, partial [Waterburya sp.]